MSQVYPELSYSYINILFNRVDNLRAAVVKEVDAILVCDLVLVVFLDINYVLRSGDCKSRQHGDELIAIADKCRKWLTVRKDPLYTQYFLLKAAEIIANMVLCINGEPASRQSIQKAIAINPGLLAPFYQDAMSHYLNDEELSSSIEKIDRFLEQNLDLIKKPVIEFMPDQEIKTITLISKHFHVEGHFIIKVFDYLAEKGVIEKVSQTIRITPKGKQTVEEIGYLYIP